MNRDLKVLAILLAMPLILFSSGYVYITMILGAVIYAMLTRMGKLRLVPAK